MKPKKILFILTSDLPLRSFLYPYFKLLKEQHHVSLYGPGSLKNISENCEVFEQDIGRKPNLFQDFQALNKLKNIVQKQDFNVVFSFGPKAGLFNALVASEGSANVHFFTGQVWATKSFLEKNIYSTIDRFIENRMTRVIVDSNGQREFLIKNGFNKKKLDVIGKGSMGGVDTHKFSKNNSNKLDLSLRNQKNKELFLFLGRASYEKGWEIFYQLAKKFQNFNFVSVGPFEDKKLKQLPVLKNLTIIDDFVSNPQDYLSKADLMILPSKREGFGSSVIEAASCGVPSIVANIYGLQDCLIDGITGFRVKKNHLSYYEEMLLFWLSLSENKREELSSNCLQFVKNNYDTQIVTRNFRKYFNERII